MGKDGPKSLRAGLEAARAILAKLANSAGKSQQERKQYESLSHRLHQTEEALVSSQEKLLLAAEAADVGVWERDLRTGRLTWDARFSNLFGIPHDAPQSVERFFLSLHLDDRQRVQQDAQRLEREGGDLNLEYRILRPDGQERWILSRGRTQQDAEGKLLRVAGIALDITERRRDLERHNQLATVVENSPNFVGIAALDHRALYLNPAGQALVGLAGNEAVLATRMEDYLFPEDLPFLAGTIMPAVLRDGRWVGEFRLRHFTTGEPIAVWWDLFAVRNPLTGEMTELAAVIRDIRAQKAAEQALRASEERFRLTFDQSPIGAALVSLDFRFQRVNDALCNITGYSAAELTSMGFPDITHPDDLTADVQQARRLMAGEIGRYDMDKRYLHKSGAAVWVHLSVRTMKDAAGRLLGFLPTMQDITQRRRAEEELRALNEALEQRIAERTAEVQQRSNQLQVLASTLAQTEEMERRRLAKILHDQLQQLLVAVQIKLPSLRNRTQDERSQQVIDQIDELIGQSISESRLLTMELSPPVLCEAGLAAGFQWLARQAEKLHDLPVEVQADPTADPPDDETRMLLFRAVRELLLNVVKHARARHVSIELLTADRDRVRVVVSDDGVGLDPATIQGPYAAGGFGLFSIRERLELVGGRLEIDAAPGRGTRMILEMPRCLARPPLAEITREAAATVATAEAVLSPAEHRAPAPGSETIRVLLADDHVILRQGIAGLLREHPAIEVVGEAADGCEAVDLALQTRPDVVLMDITMPRMNGIEATRRITEALPQSRVIGLSMHEESDMAQAIRDAGAVEYLRKDIAADALLTSILRLGSPATAK